MKENLFNFIKKNAKIYKHMMILLAIVIIYITFCLYTYNCYIKNNIISIYDNEVNQVMGEIKNNDTIKQKFVYSHKQIDCIEIKTATYGKETVGNGIITIELIDSETENILAKTEYSICNIKENSYVSILFDDPVYVDGKGELELKLTTSEMNENDKFSLWLSTGDKGAVYNEDVLENSILMRITTTETDFFSKMCLFAAVIIGITIIISYILIFVINYRKIHNYFLIYAVLIGGLYFVFIPEYETPDEQRHIHTAYSISNAILGYEEDDEVMMRQSDYEGKYLTTKYSRSSYNEYVRQLIDPDEVNDKMVNIGYKPLNTNKYLYLFSSLGITLGRVFHLGTIQTYILGSIFNYIIFVLATYFSIKKIPICKTALMLISILPMTLQQVTSYSYDCGIIMLATLMVSYSLRIAYVEEIKKRDVVILILSTVLFASVKSGAYMLMCGIVLLPIVKLWKKNTIVARVLVVGLAVSMLTIVLPIFLVGNSQTSDTLTSGYVEWAGEEGYTIEGLVSEPWHCIVIFWETIMTKLSFYIQTMIGGSLGWFQIPVQWFIVIALFMAIVVSAVKKKSETVQMSIRTRTMLTLICLFTTAFIIGALLLDWTPISHNSVEGVQGRYFLPFFIIILLIFRGDWIKTDEKADGYCICLSVLLQPFVFYALICSF